MWIIDLFLLFLGVMVAAFLGLLWWGAFHPTMWQVVLMIAIPVVCGIFWLLLQGVIPFSRKMEDWTRDAADDVIKKAKRK